MVMESRVDVDVLMRFGPAEGSDEHDSTTVRVEKHDRLLLSILQSAVY